MKKSYLTISLILFIALDGCSLFGPSDEAIPTVPPPENKPDASNVIVIKPQNKTNASGENSSINRQSTQIIENRGLGGSIDQIKVDNPGDIPDYYIYPAQEQKLNPNNQPDKIATPTWQINW